MPVEQCWSSSLATNGNDRNRIKEKFHSHIYQEGLIEAKRRESGHFLSLISQSHAFVQELYSFHRFTNDQEKKI